MPMIHFLAWLRNLAVGGAGLLFLSAFELHALIPALCGALLLVAGAAADAERDDRHARRVWLAIVKKRLDQVSRP